MLQVADPVLELDLLHIQMRTFIIHLFLEIHEILVHNSEGFIKNRDRIGKLSVLRLELINMLLLIPNRIYYLMEAIIRILRWWRSSVTLGAFRPSSM